MSGRILLAIGDPNGIGPEIAVKAASRATPVLAGDRFVIDAVSAGLGLSTRDYDADLPPERGVVDVVDVPHLPPAEYLPGVLSAEAGAATIAYATAAVTRARSGGFRAVVGCPHSETAVHAAGIPFRGYPSLLARLTGTPDDRVFLLLLGGRLRVVHATLHERLADALARLTPEIVVAAATALHDTLVAMGIGTPRLGVFGINPHAGENGLFGADDDRVTAPAVAALAGRGLAVDGPRGADVLLTKEGFDGFVAMYHDQGHIPVKTLAGKASAALTIGAGVPFCSVGHGTAFDIAGRGVADPAAVLRALELFEPVVAG